MALTKEIQELDAYGSINQIKSEDDLFEVSKNEGGPGSPSYPVGSSRKLKKPELRDILGYIPYSGPNYEIVKNSGTALENGTRLAAVMGSSYDKTPNGSPLSNTNRAVIYLLAGRYDLGGSNISIGAFVDVVSLSDPKDVIITSSNSSQTILIISPNNYLLKGVTIENTGAGIAINHGGAVIDYGTWDNIIVGSTTKNIDYNGTYNKVIATENYVLGGNITGKVTNSTFLQYSCGYGEVDCTVSGTIEDSTCDRYCFGFAEAFAGVCTVSGTIRRCKSTLRSYGFASQEAKSIVSGTIEDCEGGGEDFGGTTAIGQLIRCKTAQLLYPHAGTLDDCKISGATPNIVLKDGAKLIRSTSIASGSFGAIETELNAEVTIYQCVSNLDINSFSNNSYTNLVPLPRNVIFNQKFEVYVSEVVSPVDGFYHKFRKYIGSDGEWNTEDLGPI